MSAVTNRQGRLEKIVRKDNFRPATAAGDYIEDVLTDIFFSLPFPAVTVNTPKNVMKNNDFYRAHVLFPR